MPNLSDAAFVQSSGKKTKEVISIFSLNNMQTLSSEDDKWFMNTVSDEHYQITPCLRIKIHAAHRSIVFPA